MKSTPNVGLKDVQAVYGGPEGDLWELIMGQQIHIGGFASSMDLAEQARIAPGTKGVDLCCCTGAGMRFLVRFRQVGSMTGVDATPAVIERGRRRCREEGLAERIDFRQADVTDTGLPGGSADFVWGEDAWCYVEDKGRLIAETARLVKPGGTVAFTDWVEGAVPMTDAEAHRYMRFMKFANVLSLAEYTALLRKNGCQVLAAKDTGRFAPHVDLYLNMLNMQLTYDALKIVGFDTAVLGALGEEMKFMQKIAHEGKVIQGLIVAMKA